jgi:DNA-directed RNA polymerase subunit H (RpoH/RPB5)
VLFSKSGEPALKQLVYPSRHIIVLTDATTGKARNAMKHAVNQKNYGFTLSAAIQEGKVTGEVKPTEQKLYPMQDVYMECHTSDMFSTDIIKHRYLETYEISLATPEELKQIATIYEADIHKYPLIPDSDPIVKYFGYRPGDVLKEKSLSTTAGVSISFRTVVPAKGK